MLYDVYSQRVDLAEKPDVDAIFSRMDLRQILRSKQLRCGYRQLKWLTTELLRDLGSNG